MSAKSPISVSKVLVCVPAFNAEDVSACPLQWKYRISVYSDFAWPQVTTCTCLTSRSGPNDQWPAVTSPGHARTTVTRTTVCPCSDELVRLMPIATNTGRQVNRPMPLDSFFRGCDLPTFMYTLMRGLQKLDSSFVIPQFSSKCHLRAQESANALHPVSQKFPERWL